MSFIRGDTEYNEKGFTSIWRIENFSRCKDENDFILNSQIFTVNGLDKCKFHNAVGFHRGTLFIDIYKDHRHRYEDFQCSISILTNLGWMFKSNFTALKHKKDYTSHCREYFMELNELFLSEDMYLPNGSLTVRSHIDNHLISETEKIFLPSRMISEKILQQFPIKKISNMNSSDLLVFLGHNISKTADISSQTDVSFNVKEMKSTGVQIDEVEHSFCVTQTTHSQHQFVNNSPDTLVTLRTATKDFEVLKSLVSSKSSIFCAMFDKNMKEMGDNIVNVTDIDNDSLQLLLQFLNLKPIGDITWETAVKLYDAADRYQIQDLKNECSSLLKNMIAIENVCEALVLSDDHQDEILKRYALEYFRKNSKTVMLSKEWNSLFSNRKELASELVRNWL